MSVPLGDPAFFAGQPDEALAQLRRRCPVSRQDDDELWALTGHAAVKAVSTDPETFCSREGVLIADRSRAIAATDSILYLDPPEHAPHRKLVSRAFTPRRVAGLEPRIRSLTRELLDALDPTRPVDVVDALAAPLPLLVIAELLGLPAADRDRFRVWSDAIMAAATDLTEENAARALELFAYFDEQLDARAEQPGTDLLSVLLAAEVDGQRLERQEILGFCMTLLVAGNETTRALLSGGLVALAGDPDQRAKLVANPDLIPVAVEELLRWVTPIMAMARTATRDTEVGGTPVAAGDYLVMVYGAANRDEAVFGPDAHRLDVTRTPNPHLAFGFGEHFCLGAGLARLEAQVVLSEVLARWPDYTIDDVITAPSTLLRQIAAARIHFDPGGSHARVG